MATNNTRFLPLAVGLGLVLTARLLLKKWRQYDLRGKVVLVTGGSRGLGLVLARQLAAEGALLAICARQADELAEAEAELRSLGADVLAVRCDVSDPTDVQQLIETVADHFGRIDVLLNNAGIIQVSPLENLTLTDFEQAMNTNYYGPLHTILATLPLMKRQKEGRIVNISSVGGKASLPHMLPYSASKFALGGLSKGLRAELAKDNIVVTTVFPGLTRTGSPRQTIVKGQHEKEYAWFKIADSLPFLSSTAEDAASQIIEALKEGRAELVISLPGKLLALLNELFPEFTTDVFGLVNRLLPGPGSNERKKGFESESNLSRGPVSSISDKAAAQNNEV